MFKPGTPELESKVNGLSTIVNGLSDFSNYIVEVNAFSKAGDSPSETIFCQTKESLPTEPIRLKIVQNVGLTSTLVWLEPKRPNGIIRNYHVYIRTHEKGTEIKTVKKIVSPQNFKYYFTDLVPGETTYEACVSAENSIGEGKPSKSVTFKSANFHGRLE